jgi:hypothetical protein
MLTIENVNCVFPLPRFPDYPYDFRLFVRFYKWRASVRKVGHELFFFITISSVRNSAI